MEGTGHDMVRRAAIEVLVKELYTLDAGKSAEGDARCNDSIRRWLSRRMTYVFLDQVVLPQGCETIDDVIAAMAQWIDHRNERGQEQLDRLNMIRNVLAARIVRASRPRWFGRCLDLVTRTRSSIDELRDAGIEWCCPYLLRLSELAGTRFWRRGDGYTLPEFLLVVEADTGIRFSSWPLFSEFVIIELGQSLGIGNASHGQTRQSAHCQMIVKTMGWNAKNLNNNSATTLEDVVCDMVAVLWGVPFPKCAPTERLDLLCSTAFDVSRYSNYSGRTSGLAGLLSCMRDGRCDPGLVKEVEESLRNGIQRHKTIGVWCSEVVSLVGPGRPGQLG